ncbi:MAG: cyclic nucleotide-binding domain-containing protein [Nitrospinae bacterium]|nr:cyclic nucleotide-binding domain-containing protein [Nitrospinota bacterium]
MKKVHYNKYDLIFTEGMPGDCAYMIDEGRIAIISGKDIHDKHKVLAILHKDAIFGEMALIDEEVRSATAFALEDCTLSVITPKTLHYLFEKDALSLSPLLEILVQRLRQSTKLLRDEIKASNNLAIPSGRD